MNLTREQKLTTFKELSKIPGVKPVPRRSPQHGVPFDRSPPQLQALACSRTRRFSVRSR